MSSNVLAHQGGWDEALMVLIPIGLFVGLLVLATRRAKAIQAKRLSEESRQDRESSPPPTPEAES